MSTFADYMLAPVNLVDYPGAVVRNFAAGQPVSQINPLTSDNRASGRDVLRRFGLAGSQDTWSNFPAEVLVSAALDPITWLTGGASVAAKAMHGGKLGSAPLSTVARWIRSRGALGANAPDPMRRTINKAIASSAVAPQGAVGTVARMAAPAVASDLVDATKVLKALEAIGGETAVAGRQLLTGKPFPNALKDIRDAVRRGISAEDAFRRITGGAGVEYIDELPLVDVGSRSLHDAVGMDLEDIGGIGTTVYQPNAYQPTAVPRENIERALAHVAGALQQEAPELTNIFDMYGYPSVTGNYLEDVGDVVNTVREKYGNIAADQLERLIIDSGRRVTDAAMKFPAATISNYYQQRPNVFRSQAPTPSALRELDSMLNEYFPPVVQGSAHNTTWHAPSVDAYRRLRSVDPGTIASARKEFNTAYNKHYDFINDIAGDSEDAAVYSPRGLMDPEAYRGALPPSPLPPRTFNTYPYHSPRLRSMAEQMLGWHSAPRLEYRQ